MASIRSREGASQNATLPLMVIAFLLIGGFMYWLSITAEPTQVAIVEEDDSGAADGETVSWRSFSADPVSFAGQRITVRRVEVTSLLGTQAFWAQLSNEAPYLVKMGEGLVTSGQSLVPGQAGELTGMVYMMSDSVLDAWEAAGAFTDPVNRVEAEFATSFLEAEAFEVGGASDG